MTKDQLEQIAQRSTCCKPFGEAVTISRVERDELVALARDGMRYRWARSHIKTDHDLPGGYYLSDEGGVSWDKTIDAAMAEEGA
ncbi:hypothetical protein ACTJNK_29220 [Achromobacter anxifer]